MPGKGVQGVLPQPWAEHACVCASCRPAVPGQAQRHVGLGVVLFTMLYDGFPSTTASHRSSSARSRPRVHHPVSPPPWALARPGSRQKQHGEGLGSWARPGWRAPPECPLPLSPTIRDETGF